MSRSFAYTLRAHSNSLFFHSRHLQEIAARPVLMENLQSFHVGDSETGNGGHLTEGAVQAFLCQAQKLRMLTLDACNALTDATLIKALESCPRLESVRVTGHDKSNGRVRGAVLTALRKRKTLARNLKELVLIDQDIKDKDALSTTKVRRELAIVLGNSGDSEMPIFTFHHGQIATFDI